jgi:hypothetical protein
LKQKPRVTSPGKILCPFGPVAEMIPSDQSAARNRPREGFAVVPFLSHFCGRESAIVEMHFGHVAAEVPAFVGVRIHADANGMVIDEVARVATGARELAVEIKHQLIAFAHTGDVMPLAIARVWRMSFGGGTSRCVKEQTVILEAVHDPAITHNTDPFGQEGKRPVGRGRAEPKGKCERIPAEFQFGSAFRPNSSSGALSIWMRVAKSKWLAAMGTLGATGTDGIAALRRKKKMPKQMPHTMQNMNVAPIKAARINLVFDDAMNVGTEIEIGQIQRAAKESFRLVDTAARIGNNRQE